MIGFRNRTVVAQTIVSTYRIRTVDKQSSAHRSVTKHWREHSGYTPNVLKGWSAIMQWHLSVPKRGSTSVTAGHSTFPAPNVVPCSRGRIKRIGRRSEKRTAPTRRCNSAN